MSGADQAGPQPGGLASEHTRSRPGCGSRAGAGAGGQQDKRAGGAVMTGELAEHNRAAKEARRMLDKGAGHCAARRRRPRPWPPPHGRRDAAAGRRRGRLAQGG